MSYFVPTKPNAIYVQIACYHDMEVANTIGSAIQAAHHPENLSFGVVHQYNDESLHILDKYRGRSGFRIVEMPWTEARGVGVATAVLGLSILFSLITLNSLR